MQDAQDVMGMLVKVQNEQGEMEADDPQVLLPRNTSRLSACTLSPSPATKESVG